MTVAEEALDQALAFVLRQEGGHTADARDPGGETKFGISRRSFPDLDIRGLTETQARAIYVRHYWDALGLGRLPAPLSVCVFDASVNQGKAAAVRLLQRTLSLREDGLFGPITRERAARTGPREIDDYMARRAKRYAETPGQSIYGLGWYRRLMACHRVAMKLERREDVHDGRQGAGCAHHGDDFPDQ